MNARRLSRRSFLRCTSGVAVSLAGVSIAASCTPAGPAPTASQTAAPQETPQEVPTQAEEAKPAAKEDVVLRLHMRAGTEVSEAPLYVTIPEELTEEHPHIKVELVPHPGDLEGYETKVMTMAAAGTIGDVILAASHSGWHMRLVRLGYIAPMDEQLDAHGISKDEWVPGAVAALSYEGKMYGPPKQSASGASFVWINEDMFAAAGIPIPEVYNENTHSNVLEWAQAMAQGTQDNREVYGFAMPITSWEYFYNGLRTYGGWEHSEDGTEALLDSAECYEWASWVNNMFVEGLTPHTEALPDGGMQALFAAQRVPMVLHARWFNKTIKEAVAAAGSPFQWRAIRAPRESNANGWISVTSTHCATAASKHPEEAFLLSYAMASKRCAELTMPEIGYTTARIDDLDTITEMGGDPFLELQYRCGQEAEAIRLPENCRGGEARTVLSNELQRIWHGDVELTPDAMKECKAAVDEVLNKPF